MTRTKTSGPASLEGNGQGSWRTRHRVKLGSCGPHRPVAELRNMKWPSGTKGKDIGGHPKLLLNLPPLLAVVRVYLGMRQEGCDRKGVDLSGFLCPLLGSLHPLKGSFDGY